MKSYQCQWIFLTALMFFASSTYAQIKLDPQAPWVTLFEDEFTTYNSIYELSNNYRLDDQRCNTYFEITPQTAEINRGILTLKAVKNYPTCNDGSVLDYTGLSLKYKNIYSPPACNWEYAQLGFRYGLYEIRCKLPKDQFNASFWLYNGAEEWNLIESTGDGLPTNVHDYPRAWDTPEFPVSNQFPDRRTCGAFVPVERDLTSHYHTYSFMWDYDNKTLTWFFDGREIRTETRQRIFPCNQPFIFGISQGYASADTGAFDIDYVRVMGLKDTSALYRYKYSSRALPQDKKISDAPDALAVGDASRIFYRNAQNNISSLQKVNGIYIHESITNNNRYHVEGDLTVGSENIVFYRGSDERLHIVTSDGEKWTDQRMDSAYISSLYGGALASNLSTGGGSHVFFRGPNGWMTHYYKSRDNKWIPGPVVSDYDPNHQVGGDIVVADNGQVFYVGADNRIQLYSWNASSGWSHHYVDNNWSTSAYKAASNSGTLKVSNGTLFYRGLDNKIRTYSFDHDTQAWVNEVLPFEMPADFVCGEIALPKGQNEEVYFIGADGYVQHCYLYKGHWLHRWVDERLDDTPAQNTPDGIDLVAFLEGEQKNIVYVRDDYLRIFTNHWVDYGELENLICNPEGVARAKQEEALSLGGNKPTRTAGHHIAEDYNLTVIPNPVASGDNIMVRISAEHSSQKLRRAFILVYDTNGRLVAKLEKRLNTFGHASPLNGYTFSLRGTNLSKGLYTLVITFANTGGTKSARFVVQ